MLTLLIVACIGGTDDCRPTVVAGGFIHEDQCRAYKRLMIEGWKAIHPDMEVRRDICTDKPAYIIGQFQT